MRYVVIREGDASLPARVLELVRSFTHPQSFARSSRAHGRRRVRVRRSHRRYVLTSLARRPRARPATEFSPGRTDEETDQHRSFIPSRRRPATHGGRRGVHGRRDGLVHHARPRVPRTAQSVSMRRDDVRARRGRRRRARRAAGRGADEGEDEEETVQISVPRALSQVSQTNQRRRGVEFLILTALRRHRERYNRRRRARRRRAVSSSGARARRRRARQIHHHLARVGR